MSLKFRWIWFFLMFFSIYPYLLFAQGRWGIAFSAGEARFMAREYDFKNIFSNDPVVSRSKIGGIAEWEFFLTPEISFLLQGGRFEFQYQNQQYQFTKIVIPITNVIRFQLGALYFSVGGGFLRIDGKMSFNGNGFQEEQPMETAYIPGSVLGIGLRINIGKLTSLHVYSRFGRFEENKYLFWGVGLAPSI